MHEHNDALHKAFFRWLRHHGGHTVKVEDFRFSTGAQEPAEGWQKAMTALTTSARAAGLIRPCGVTRDAYHSYKTKWRVAA